MNLDMAAIAVLTLQIAVRPALTAPQYEIVVTTTAPGIRAWIVVDDEARRWTLKSWDDVQASALTNDNRITFDTSRLSVGPHHFSMFCVAPNVEHTTKWYVNPIADDGRPTDTSPFIENRRSVQDSQIRCDFEVLPRETRAVAAPVSKPEEILSPAPEDRSETEPRPWWMLVWPKSIAGRVGAIAAYGVTAAGVLWVATYLKAHAEARAKRSAPREKR